jgi:hypothetical protein
MKKNPVFSFDEINAILCEACALNISTVFISGPDTMTMYHPLNGQQLICKAADWRLKGARELNRREDQATTRRRKTTQTGNSSPRKSP